MNGTARGLKASTEPLVEVYDCAMLDLDGVVYVGGDAVPGVPDLLRQLRDRGVTLAFVTNNAARPPAAVAQHLNDLGVDARPTDVVTSAQAAAREVASRVPAGSKVLVVGGEGLEQALRELGLEPVRGASDQPAAVVQGFHPSLDWKALAEGGYALRGSGLPWVASNLDLTVPTAHGIAPGNGALVNAVAAAADRRPDVVAGKPYRPLFDETVRRIASDKPIVVGDRLDTDIEGALNCGADSLLVMTGVTDVHSLCRAPSQQRPDFVGWTMDALFHDHSVPVRNDGRFELSGWTAAVDRRGDTGTVVVHSRGADPGDGLRAVAAAAWQARDETPDLQLDTAGLDDVWRHR